MGISDPLWQTLRRLNRPRGDVSAAFFREHVQNTLDHVAVRMPVLHLLSRPAASDRVEASQRVRVMFAESLSKSLCLFHELFSLAFHPAVVCPDAGVSAAMRVCC